MFFLLIKNDDVLKILGKKIKQTRLSQKYTQEYVAESIDISIDLLRNIENGRNIGSVPTLLNLCNFLNISPNCLFSELLTFKEDTLDTFLVSTVKNIIKVVAILNFLSNIATTFYFNLSFTSFSSLSSDKIAVKLTLP